MSISKWSPRSWSGGRPGAVSLCSRRPREQRAQADQVVGGRCEGDDPVDERTAAMAELAQAAHGLQPAEDLLNQLPFPLAGRVARMPRRPLVDGTPRDLL